MNIFDESLNNYKIALVINCDNNYFEYGLTAIKSFLFHNKWFNGDIVFFDDEEYFRISEDNINILKTIYKNVIIKKIDFSKYKFIIEKFSNINNNDGSWQCFLKSYPKIEIFNLKEYDKILCIDGDILFVDNIKDLFKSSSSLGITSAMLFNHYYLEGYDLSNLKFKRNDDLIELDSGGFNAGVIYIGNNKFLNKDITNKIINYINDLLNSYDSTTKLYGSKNIKFFEQCILNYFFTENYNNEVTYIDPIYNTELCDIDYLRYEFISNRSNDFLKYLYNNKKILHYLWMPDHIHNNCKNKFFYKLWSFYNKLPIFLIK